MASTPDGRMPMAYARQIVKCCKRYAVNPADVTNHRLRPQRDRFEVPAVHSTLRTSPCSVEQALRRTGSLPSRPRHSSRVRRERLRRSCRRRRCPTMLRRWLRTSHTLGVVLHRYRSCADTRREGASSRAARGATARLRSDRHRAHDANDQNSGDSSVSHLINTPSSISI